MQLSTHSDQVGSLMRPQRLVTAHVGYRDGRVSAEELRQAEDEAILESLARQKQIAIGVLSDGEMRRDSWQTDLSAAVDGFAVQYPRALMKRADGTQEEVERHTKQIIGKLRPRRRLTEWSAPFLKEHASGPFKVTMPSPNTAVGMFRPGVTDEFYPTLQDLQRDLQSIVGDEMRYLVDLGVPYLQLDEGFVPWISDSTPYAADPDITLDDCIAIENGCYDALPRDRITLACHLCRGNRLDTGGSGSYDRVAEQLFNELHVDRFLLEYDSERAGGFEPLRFLPRGKMVVLGLITSKSATLESEDALVRRIDEAARYCPLEQLGISAQCGFFHAWDFNVMSMDDQWRKLELVVDIARRVWG